MIRTRSRVCSLSRPTRSGWPDALCDRQLTEVFKSLLNGDWQGIESGRVQLDEHVKEAEIGGVEFLREEELINQCVDPLLEISGDHRVSWLRRRGFAYSGLAVQPQQPFHQPHHRVVART